MTDHRVGILYIILLKIRIWSYDDKNSFVAENRNGIRNLNDPVKNVMS